MSFSARNLVTAGVLLATSLALCSAWVSPGPDLPPTLQAPGAAVESSLQELRDELGELEGTVHDLSQRVAEGGDERDTPAAATRQAEDLASAMEGVNGAVDDHPLARLQHALTEPVDPAWAFDAQRELSTAFADGPDLRFIEAACSSTLCRVELSAHANVEAQDVFARLPWSSAAFLHLARQDDGGVSIGLYLARDGHDLPSADPADDSRGRS